MVCCNKTFIHEERLNKIEDWMKPEKPQDYIHLQTQKKQRKLVL
jgi:hypothetical protein